MLAPIGGIGKEIARSEHDLEHDLTLGAELERGDAGSDIQPGLALDRQGLQRDRTIEAADQGIGAQAQTGRHLGGGAGIAALRAPRATLPGANTTQVITASPEKPISRPNLRMTPE